MDDQGAMAGPGQRFRLYRSQISIILSAALAAVFALRAAMAAAGASSLAGPGWTIIDALIAVAAGIRCFDRVVVTSRRITVFRMGIPRRLVAERIHQLQIVDQRANWSRLYAETVDGKRTLVTMEKRNAPGQARMRQLLDQVQMMLGSRLQPLKPEAAAPAATPQKPSAPAARRRCIRSGCPAYLGDVVTTECESCGSPTQRVSA